MLDGHPTLPAEIAVIPSQTAPDHAPNSAPNVKHKTLLEIILREGRNRQIRRVAEQLGHPVLQLHRAAIGPIHLQAIDTPELLSGDCRALTDIERSFLNSQIALTSKREPVKNEECHV
jgi:23S rRNA pseudouridine2605 synthase